MNKTELSNSILEQINRLTPSERDGLLFRYMLNERMAEADEPCCKVSMVRNDNVNGTGVRGKYDVVIESTDGNRKVIDFGSRLEKLFYVLAIEHTDGYRRDALRSKYSNELFDLWGTNCSTTATSSSWTCSTIQTLSTRYPMPSPVLERPSKRPLEIWTRAVGTY